MKKLIGILLSNKKILLENIYNEKDFRITLNDEKDERLDDFIASVKEKDQKRDEDFNRLEKLVMEIHAKVVSTR